MRLVRGRESMQVNANDIGILIVVSIRKMILYCPRAHIISVCVCGMRDA